MSDFGNISDLTIEQFEQLVKLKQAGLDYLFHNNNPRDENVLRTPDDFVNYFLSEGLYNFNFKIFESFQILILKIEKPLKYKKEIFERLQANMSLSFSFFILEVPEGTFPSYKAESIKLPKNCFPYTENAISLEKFLALENSYKFIMED